MTESPFPRIDGARVMSRLAALSRIGRLPNGGITRLALSDEDWEAHTLFARWMRDTGLNVSMDAAGNLFGRLEGEQPALPSLLIGSHLDTVPEGGAFDGALGCVAALEVAASIASSSIRQPRSLEVVVWTDEEGARFGAGLMGSRAFCGQVSAEDLELTDRDGVSVVEALQRRGLDPAEIPAMSPRPIYSYLELHIEQGPTLEDLGIPVGIVTGIVAMISLQIEVIGSAGHAGTTPMTARRDALVAAAEIVLAAERAAREVGEGAVATVGHLAVSPDAANVIPGRCTFSIDVRSLDRVARDEVYELVCASARESAARRGVEVHIHEALRVPPVPMSERLQALLARACEQGGLPVHRLPSGAGHDAMILARVTDAGMLFTRCRGGISHNPAEGIQEHDAAAGAQVLLDAALSILKGELE